MPVSSSSSDRLVRSSSVPRSVHVSVCSRRLVGVVLGGQLLALVITGSGVFSQLLADKGVNIPTSQSCVNYLVLATFLIPRLRRWRQRRQHHTRHLLDEPHGQSDKPTYEATHTHESTFVISDGITPSSSSSSSSSAVVGPDAPFLLVAAWKYFFLAACDVEGNFLLVKAYQHTTITSVQLLDCFTIPMVMILGYLFMHARYNRKHMVGAFICLIGLALLITSDLIEKKNDDADANADNKVLGDIFVLIGCVFYAVSNLGQEYLVKSFDRFEFLGMLGLCGSIISAVQMAILERDALAQVQFSDPVVCAYLVGFNACLFVLYYFTPLLLVHSSALFMNLSFLTSDFWSILFAVSMFHARLNLLYFAAFGIIIVGLLIYNLAGVDGDLFELAKELCSASHRQVVDVVDGHPDVSGGHDIDAVEESDLFDSTAMPTTHAHTHPMHAPDGFTSIQDATIGVGNMQQTDQMQADTEAGHGHNTNRR